MVRLQCGADVVYLRQPTQIQMGHGGDLIASVICTNPGKFQFGGPVHWTVKKCGSATLHSATSTGYPDLTMQNIIHAVQQGYSRAGLGEPSGVIRLHNLSNVRQPDSGKAEDLHRRVKEAMNLDGYDACLLEDSATRSLSEFGRLYEESPVVLMGFVAGVFQEESNRVIAWAEQKQNSSKKCKVIAAVDTKGRYAHPRRWRTEEELRIQVIEKLSVALS